ncbi:cystatin-A-like isoform X2 [Emydura macquarii macquarii]|uniref:cystatin-A-like isoform X2 n=1 Tax=Emydura macquarii macquarii TaxID=1129001 RepID=UPI00352A5696
MSGDFSETKPATPEIQEIADQVKPELEKRTGEKYPDFDAISFRYQIVHGTNYLIKVSIKKSKDECVHLMVYQSLPCDQKDPSLTSYQTGKTKDDPLEPFH